jgi:hypothetical protein
MYHIKKDQNDVVDVNIYGISYLSSTNERELIENLGELPKLIHFETGEEYPVNHIRYMLRQTTQELLFKAKSVNDRRGILALRNNIRTLFDVIRSYMKKNDFEADNFMIQLCDDLCITYKNIGTNTGNMFILSRYTSQGRQQTYSATPRNPNAAYSVFDVDDDNDITLPPSVLSPVLARSATSTFQQFPVIDEDDNMDNYPVVENRNKDEDEMSVSEIDTYVISGNNMSCFANDATITTMSQMSQYDSVNMRA